MERFSDHISARRDPGETETHLAARLGISRSYWRHLLTGRREMTLAVAARAIRIWPDLEDIYLDLIRAKLRELGAPTVSAQTEEAGRSD